MIRGVESDAVRRQEAYPAEDVEMDLTGADIPDDEFPEEPHVGEVSVPKEIPNAAKLKIMRVHRNLGHPSKELLCRAVQFGGANDVCMENKPPESNLPSKLSLYSRAQHLLSSAIQKAG